MNLFKRSSGLLMAVTLAFVPPDLNESIAVLLAMLLHGGSCVIKMKIERTPHRQLATGVRGGLKIKNRIGQLLSSDGQDVGSVHQPYLPVLGRGSDTSNPL
jgi:hypothetical protein